jgi:hypothetical protein
MLCLPEVTMPEADEGSDRVQKRKKVMPMSSVNHFDVFTKTW